MKGLQSVPVRFPRAVSDKWVSFDCLSVFDKVTGLIRVVSNALRAKDVVSIQGPHNSLLLF